MKTGKAWSLRDVDDQTRAALLKAAEKSGLSVTDWLGTSPDSPAQAAPPPPASPMARPVHSGPIPAPAIPAKDELPAGEDDPSAEVREAIGRLTARLGIMDDHARGLVNGLQPRLAEIENRLAFLVEAKQNPDERARSLADASTMIDGLVRDIDGMALRASALGSKPPAPAPGEPAAPPRLVAPAAKPAQPPTTKPTGMSPAAEQLADIRFQLDALLSDETGAQPMFTPSRPAQASTLVLKGTEAPAAKAGAQAPTTATLVAPQASVAPAAPRAATPFAQQVPATPVAAAPVSTAAQTAPDQHLHRMEAKLGEIMSRLPVKKDTDLASAIREISARQKTIDDRAEAATMRRDQKALGDAVKALHSEVATLATKVAAISVENAGDATAINDLAKRIDTLSADRPADRSLLNAIRGDIDQLKASLTDGSVRSAIGDLEARYSEVAERVDAFMARVPDGARIDALGEQIAALRDALEGGGDRGATARLESRLGEISRAVSDMADQGPAVIPAPSADLTRLEQRFDSLAKTVGMALSRAPVNSGLADETDAFHGRLDEIAASLSSLAAKTEAMTSESPTVAALEGRLSQMASTINGLLNREATGQPAPVLEQIESRLDTIKEGVDSLFMGMPPTETNTILERIDHRFDRFASIVGSGAGAAPQALARLEERLERIAADLENFGPPQAGTHDEAGLNRRLDQVAEAITGLARRTPAMGEIETLHTRLAAIADRIEQVSVPETTIQADLEDIRTEVSSIRAVHQRLQTLTERIDSIAAVQHQPLMAIAEIKVGIGAIRSLQDRMQSITDRIDRMTAAQRDPVPAEQLRAGIAAMRSVQERVQAMSERLEAESAAPGQSLAELKAGIAAISGVSEQMKSLAGQIQGMAVQRAPVAVLEDIKHEIVTIRSEIAERRGPSTEPLERLVADLAKQVGNVSRSPSDPTEIADLAHRVTELAGELEDAKPRMVRLEEIERRMARLQEALSDTRAESVEAAKAEARAVVSDLSRMVATGEIDAAVIGALVKDLEGLKTTAADSDRRVRTKLDAANTTIAQVVARLTQLEGEASRRPTGMNETVASALSGNDWTKSTPAETPPELPPALSAPASAEKDPRERRADFIAAARRAAQAAAEEAAKPRGEGDASAERPGALTRFSQAILNRKRTLLLAAAAVVLAVGALQIFAGRLNGSDAARLTAAVHPAPAVSHDVVASIPAPVPSLAPVATPARESLIAPAPQLVAPTVDRDVTFAAPVYGAPLAAPAVERAPVVAAPVTTAPAPVVLAASTPADTATSQTNPLVDRTIGSQRLTNAALNGDPAAAFEVGARYAAGERVTRNMPKAAEWYQRAAEGGVAVAQFRLASLYERGDGVGPSLTASLDWYQRAADRGNVNAMHNLAVLLSQGVDGAPANPQLAMKWFQSAANFGLRDSQYNLGVIYARGLGTIPNFPESYKWFSIAAKNGDPDAAARRDEMAKSLTPAEIAQMQAAVTGFKAKQPIVEANAVAAPSGGWDADQVSDLDRLALVKTIQTLLADQGYDPGPADGMAGPKTRQAVKSYQQKTGMPATGQIDNTLLAFLSDPR